MILAVTGTIGSGKSTVCRILKDKGFPVVSADEIGHRVLGFDSVKKEISEYFGNVFDENGNVDRQKLARKAFSSQEHLKKLNEITHPIIRKEIKKETDALEKISKTVICEIPLLFECGFQDLADKILLVYVSDKTALERLKGRGMTEEDALKRLKNQEKWQKKAEKSDFLLSNEENFEKLLFKVDKLLNKC